MRQNHLKNPIFWAFALSIIYWGYLFFTTSMDIKFDAIGYEKIGTIIYQKGWSEYFNSGPYREPLYSFLISISMRLGDFFSISYQSIQKFFQLAILLFSQLLVLAILKKLKINQPWSAITIFYMGVSPALVNSALSLYSEILCYPFVLLIILFASKSWRAFTLSKTGHIRNGVFCGLLFVGVTFVKAIFEVITPIFLIPYFLFCLKSLLEKRKIIFFRSVAFFFAFLIVFYGSVISYKYINLKHNNHFALTDRGPFLFYGNAVRRIEKITPRSALAALASVPGDGVCLKFADPTLCEFWSFRTADGFGMGKYHNLIAEGKSPEQTDKILMRLGVAEILKNPLQYMLLMGVENLKMFFWESTQIGYVSYPSVLTKLFIFTPFKNGLRLLMSLLTFWALYCLVRFNWLKKGRLFLLEKHLDETTSLLFWMCNLIFLYMGAHTFFTIITRYALPIAPLYLILIAFSFNRLDKTAQSS